MQAVSVLVNFITMFRRSKCKLQVGDLEGALVDCNGAIELDDRCAEAFGVRADTLLALHQSDEDHDGIRVAAKDALRGFLLSGSVNLELASKSEDIAREVCRVESKQIFNERVTLRKYLCNHASGDRPTYALRKDRLPRYWLVISYFLGYEPLERGLELDVERAKRIHEMSMNFITDSSVSVSRAGIAPPQHLLDLDALEIYRKFDFYGYELLQQLVQLLQKAVEGNTTKTSNSDCSEISIQTVDNMQQIPADILDTECVSEIIPLAHSDAVVCGYSVEENISNIILEIQQLYEVNASIDSSVDNAAHCAEYLDAYLLLVNAKVTLNDTDVAFLDVVLGVRNEINSFGAITVYVARNYSDSETENLISNPLRARFLNVISSIAFLAGDAIGAVECLRESHAIDERLMDTYIKLGCLLIDMDELEEVLLCLYELLFQFYLYV